ncbi:YkyA family protein [Bacillus sp. DJP31]|uniref:YkyA family protein n=1 Tax=Bacillus sp. DJP31 TaxID=3409789 RepID=UPI003BB54F01
MKYVLIILGLLSILLSACQTGPLPEEQIYVHLEQAVKLEAEFENQQDPIVELEQKEKELYDQIIELGLKELDQIKKLSTDALSLVADRKSRLEKEYESIKQSKIEFDKTAEIVEQIDAEQPKLLANEVVGLMNERFLAYEELYKAYSSSITLDEELYKMFQREDLKLEELESQIEKINKSYEQVITLNETFNKLTTEYNNQKRTFYEAAGIAVTYGKE